MIALRTRVYLLGLAAALAALCAPAAAFQYCPVSVGAIQALQFGAADAYHRIADRRFGVEFRSAEPSAAGVELSIVANDTIYRATLSQLTFAAGDTAIAFFSFEHPRVVDYVWVSKVIDPSGAFACPLDPFRASHEYFNDRRLARADVAERMAANERILAAAARDAPMTHPEAVARVHRDCPTPDQTPTINHEVPPNGGDLRSLKGPTPVVALVHVSPGGEPVDVELVQSSPFLNLNAAVVESARTSTYFPATVDCMPSTGIYLFKAIFGT